jgi:methionyl-tRNA formyltransferase
MRVVMMGTGPFAVPTFRSLLESDCDVVCLVTRPLPPVRSRKAAKQNPMREAGERFNLPILAPADINSSEGCRELADQQPDLLVVCDYGQILSAKALTIPALGGINLHGSLLPRYRGAAPVNWAILNGDEETGVSVIHMTPRLDAGPILATRRTPIGTDETAAELEPRLAELGISAVHEAIEMLRDWDRVSIMGEIQDPAAATRAPRLRKSDGKVDWNRPAEEIRNQLRGLTPWPGTFTHWPSKKGDLRLILNEVEIAPGTGGDAPPGSVMQADRNGLVVATNTEHLIIKQLQPAGKRVMDADEFLRGHPPPEGLRLT